MRMSALIDGGYEAGFEAGFEAGLQRAIKIAQGGNKKREPWNGQTIAKAIRDFRKKHRALSQEPSP